MESKQLEELISFFDKKFDWLGWRIGSSLSESGTEEVLDGIKQEISKLNLTLNKINDNLNKIAGKN